MSMSMKEYRQKELPKKINEKVKCVNCKYYEGPGWKPWWTERYCHHPKIIRTGLVETTFGCERWKENLEVKEKDFVVYFKTCLEKEYLVLDKRLTLRYMKEALEEYERLKKEDKDGKEKRVDGLF